MRKTEEMDSVRDWVLAWAQQEWTTFVASHGPDEAAALEAVQRLEPLYGGRYGMGLYMPHRPSPRAIEQRAQRHVFQIKQYAFPAGSRAAKAEYPFFFRAYLSSDSVFPNLPEPSREYSIEYFIRRPWWNDAETPWYFFHKMFNCLECRMGVLRPRLECPYCEGSGYNALELFPFAFDPWQPALEVLKLTPPVDEPVHMAEYRRE